VTLEQVIFTKNEMTPFEEFEKDSLIYDLHLGLHCDSKDDSAQHLKALKELWTNKCPKCGRDCKSIHLLKKHVQVGKRKQKKKKKKENEIRIFILQLTFSFFVVLNRMNIR
jgi:hypothetical protein